MSPDLATRGSANGRQGPPVYSLYSESVPEYKPLVLVAPRWFNKVVSDFTACL